LNKGNPTRENTMPQAFIVPPLKEMANIITIDNSIEVKALVEITQCTPSKGQEMKNTQAQGTQATPLNKLVGAH